MATPNIRPVSTKEFGCSQSRYTHAPTLPMRALIYGPSGSGKTVLLQSLILDVFRDCFARVYIFSPSVDLDHTWAPVKQYIEHRLHVDPRKEQYAFSEYDPEALASIIDTQMRVAELMKRSERKIHGILIIVDDFADAPEFTRQSKLLHQLYVRGRHAFISVVTSVQKVTTVAPLIRTQATALFVFRLRSYQDLQTFLEEASALYDKKVLLQLYHYCVDQPFGFLYLDLTARDRENMFFYKLEQRLVPK
jgi:GTPase SAR1 family protein